MNFFNPTEPLLRSKQEALDIQDLVGLLQIQWRVGKFTLFSGLYTRVDQAFLIWGAIAGLIFASAQFFAYSWQWQAVLWSGLTLVGVFGMIRLTRFWAKVEQLCWVVYLWAGLMLFGMGLTDLGIFCGWSEVLIHLCPLWLGLCAVGYIGTGLGVRSRALLLVGLMHLIIIPVLPYVSAWQFLTTAIVMGGSLVTLALCQWDMRAPVASAILTDEQRQFNLRQQQLRQGRT